MDKLRYVFPKKIRKNGMLAISTYFTLEFFTTGTFFVGFYSDYIPSIEHLLPEFIKTHFCSDNNKILKAYIQSSLLNKLLTPLQILGTIKLIKPLKRLLKN